MLPESSSEIDQLDLRASHCETLILDGIRTRHPSESLVSRIAALGRRSYRARDNPFGMCGEVLKGKAELKVNHATFVNHIFSSPISSSNPKPNSFTFPS